MCLLVVRVSFAFTYSKSKKFGERVEYVKVCNPIKLETYEISNIAIALKATVHLFFSVSHP